MNLIEAQQLTKEDIALLKAFIGLSILYKAYEENWKTLPKSYKQQFVDGRERQRYENSRYYGDRA